VEGCGRRSGRRRAHSDISDDRIGDCLGRCVEGVRAAGLDDALDVWGVHGMGGFLGAVLLGPLADGGLAGPDAGQPARSGALFGRPARLRWSHR
jgi:hypothetical protein